MTGTRCLGAGRRCLWDACLPPVDRWFPRHTAESMAMEGMMNLDEVVLYGEADMQQRQGKGGFKLYFIYM